MYNVSEKYKSAIENSSECTNNVSGAIYYNTDEKILDIVDNIIIPGSLQIDKRATDNTFGVGCVNISQLSISLKLPTEYIFDNSYIVLNYNYVFSDGTIETIPLGKYYIVKITQNKGIATLNCYDAMYKFDESVTADMNGSPYSILNTICNHEGITLGNTSQEIEALANGNIILTVKKDDFATYREIISEISSLLGVFCTIGRDNKLYLKKLGENIVSTYKSSNIVDATYENWLASVKWVIGEFNVDGNNKQRFTEISYGVGMTVNLKNIKSFNGSSDNCSAIVSNIANQLSNLIYKPCTIKTITDPSIDVGDKFYFQERFNNEKTSIGLLTHYTWNYHKGQTLYSEAVTEQESRVQNAESLIPVQSAEGGGLDPLDVINSPIVDYSDKTATIKVRLDNDELAEMDLQDRYTKFYSPNNIMTISNGPTTKVTVKHAKNTNVEYEIKNKYFNNNQYVYKEIANNNIKQLSTLTTVDKQLYVDDATVIKGIKNKYFPLIFRVVLGDFTGDPISPMSGKTHRYVDVSYKAVIKDVIVDVPTITDETNPDSVKWFWNVVNSYGYYDYIVPLGLKEYFDDETFLPGNSNAISGAEPTNGGMYLKDKTQIMNNFIPFEKTSEIPNPRYRMGQYIANLSNLSKNGDIQTNAKIYNYPELLSRGLSLYAATNGASTTLCVPHSIKNNVLIDCIKKLQFLGCDFAVSALGGASLGGLCKSIKLNVELTDILGYCEDIENPVKNPTITDSNGISVTDDKYLGHFKGITVEIDLYSYLFNVLKGTGVYLLNKASYDRTYWEVFDDLTTKARRLLVNIYDYQEPLKTVVNSIYNNYHVKYKNIYQTITYTLKTGDLGLSDADKASADLKRQSASLDSRVADLENRMTNAEKDIKSLKREVGFANNNIAKNTEDILSIDGQVTGLDGRVTTLEQKPETSVIVDALQLSGKHIADITVNGEKTGLYAPDGGSGGGSEVSYAQTLTEGTKIGAITIDGQNTDIYAPTQTTVNVTPLQSSGKHIADITVNGEKTELYAPNGEGGGSTVVVNPTLTTGTKIADIEVDGINKELFAPNGGTGEQIPGHTEANIGQVLGINNQNELFWRDFSQVDIYSGQPGQVLTKGEGYSYSWQNVPGSSGAVDSVNGKIGNVVLNADDVGAQTKIVPTESQHGQFLGAWNGNLEFRDVTMVDIYSGQPGQVLTKGEGYSYSWQNAPGGGSGGSNVEVVTKQTTGTNIADIKVDDTTYKLFAPNGEGGSGVIKPEILKKIQNCYIYAQSNNTYFNIIGETGNKSEIAVYDVSNYIGCDYEFSALSKYWYNSDNATGPNRMRCAFVDSTFDPNMKITSNTNTQVTKEHGCFVGVDKNKTSPSNAGNIKVPAYDAANGIYQGWGNTISGIIPVGAKYFLAHISSKLNNVTVRNGLVYNFRIFM